MASATSRFDRASARVAQEPQADPIGDRVEQMTAAHAFAANVATVRAADDMVGTLIDIVA